MTDNEIIKALECCGDEEMLNCSICPLHSENNTCQEDLYRYALDLITRQKAENLNLTSHLTSLQNDLTSAKAEIEKLKCGCKKLVKKQELYKENMQATREWQIEQAKAEAIKEFAERLKKEALFNSGWCVLPADEIDNLVKEMVGDV